MGDRMRITFVTPPPELSGGMRVIAAHAGGLSRRGHTVTVVFTPHRPFGVRERLRSLVRRGVWLSTPDLDPTFFEGLDVALRGVERWRPIVADDLPDADVVVATWWETAEWVLALPPAKGAKAYLVQGYEAHSYLPVDRVNRTYTFPMHKVVVARWLADLMASRFGDHDASLVPNSVDTDLFHAPPRGKQPVPTVGLAYSTVPCKACEVALAAFEPARQAVPGLRLVSFGTTPPAREMPLPPDAVFTLAPRQAALRDLYASSDAWLMPSRSEGFGLPILEAMACRTPAIATRTGAAPELLEGGGGILVNPEDSEGMARAIERLCGLSESEWRAMSDSAYTTATRYTWDDATDLFEAALRTAIERTAG